jgi:serine/threonine protein kinase
MIKSSRVVSQPAAIPGRSQPALISIAMDASCSSKYWDCVGSELQAEEDPNPRELSQQTYYGSAPEHLWTQLAEPGEDPAARIVQETDKYEDQWLRDLLEVTSIDPSQLQIGESIAEGGQAHVFLAKYTRWPEKWKQDVVVKRYKGRLGVRAVHELRRRIQYLQTERSDVSLCRLIGLSEDNITGEVSVVMDAYRGDLRNLIDKRMEYRKSRMRSNMQDDDATQMMMMPFPYDSTLQIMDGIAFGMRHLCKIGIIHRDLKASNIFVSPLEFQHGSAILHNSRKVELKDDLDYDRYWVYVGDYESSDGVVGTGFWRPPEVLKAVKEDITPTYTTAADVYGFGMVCYELLTGHIPFQCEDVRRTDYDAVLSGRRPRLPDYLSPGMTQLLIKCWHHDPCQRPTWDEIKKTLYTKTMILLGRQCRNLPPAVYNISKGHP